MSLHSYVIGQAWSLHKLLNVKGLADNTYYARHVAKMNSGSFASIVPFALISIPTNVAYSSMHMLLSVFSSRYFNTLGYIHLLVWP